MLFTIICLMICLLVKPSISLSGVTITLCCNTGTATCLMSSGVTKSLPLMAAKAFDAFNKAIDALGDAPKYRKELLRVLTTISAMY